MSRYVSIVALLLLMSPTASHAADTVLLHAAGSLRAAITNEAVDELGLASGKAAYAVIKASDVMIGVD